MNGPTIAGGSSAKTEEAPTLHIVLQAKEGIGKTVVALLLSQCIEEGGKPVVSVDADPVRVSLSGLAMTGPERRSLFAGDRIDRPAHDRFMVRLQHEGVQVVVDSAASGFVPIGRYLVENDVAPNMSEAGHDVVAHVVVTGGPAMLATMKGLDAVVRHFPPRIRIVVWLNEYFGPIANTKGEPFEEMPAYTDNRERIFALVRLATPGEPASADLQMMFDSRLTFTRALAPDNASILLARKSRLFRIRETLWPQIARAL